MNDETKADAVEPEDSALPQTAAEEAALADMSAQGGNSSISPQTTTLFNTPIPDSDVVMDEPEQGEDTGESLTVEESESVCDVVMEEPEQGDDGLDADPSAQESVPNEEGQRVHTRTSFMSEESFLDELPIYLCHKEVSAAQILDVAPREEGGAYICLVGNFGNIRVNGDWLARNPDVEPGGYFVVYKGGYSAYSPQQAFEEGYELKGVQPA